jgi:hypothetical protein
MTSLVTRTLFLLRMARLWFWRRIDSKLWESDQRVIMMYNNMRLILKYLVDSGKMNGHIPNKPLPIDDKTLCNAPDQVLLCEKCTCGDETGRTVFYYTILGT